MSRDSNAICYVFPVLWMTSCFLRVEQMDQNQRQWARFRPFSRWRHRGWSVPSQTASCYRKELWC